MSRQQNRFYLVVGQPESRVDPTFWYGEALSEQKAMAEWRRVWQAPQTVILSVFVSDSPIEEI